jgi:hypothetical protein
MLFRVWGNIIGKENPSHEGGIALWARRLLRNAISCVGTKYVNSCSVI